MIWFLLTFAGETGLVLHQRSTARREKSSHIQRNTSMAVENVHHYDQGHLWWSPCGAPQPWFLVSKGVAEVLLPISSQCYLCFSSLHCQERIWTQNSTVRRSLREVCNKYNILWGDWWYTAAFTSLPEEIRFKKNPHRQNIKQGFSLLSMTSVILRVAFIISLNFSNTTMITYMPWFIL